jgi:predicted HAD superfamily Cof-like phosphohydrolase
MKHLIDDVTAFHVACGVPVLDAPQIPHEDIQTLRIKLIDEEINHELLPAMDSGSTADLPAIADGIVDSIYVLVGAALSYGIPLARVWEAVQTANMAKADPVTGMVKKRSDGKVMKPDGWTPPDIAAVLWP